MLHAGELTLDAKSTQLVGKDVVERDLDDRVACHLRNQRRDEFQHHHLEQAASSTALTHTWM